jgi:hypothetical protein
MAQKFRKKPVIIEAVQFNGDNAQEIRAFVGTHESPDPKVTWGISSFRLVVDDLFSKEYGVVAEVWDKLHETWVGVKVGQWIIKGVDGEFYPCDPDVFEKTYSREGW